MSTHTGGTPWTAILDEAGSRDDGREDVWYVLTKNEAAIAVGLYGPDARLIAAAPDLLAVCKRLIEAAGDRNMPWDKVSVLRFVEIWGDMRAAIAKAEGVS